MRKIIYRSYIYRCRVCGKDICYYRSTKDMADRTSGALFTPNYHRNCTYLEEGQKAYCDLIKQSEFIPDDCCDLLVRVETEENSKQISQTVHEQDFIEFHNSHSIVTSEKILLPVFRHIENKAKGDDFI